MLRAAENRKFEVILCKNQSRFSRDMEIIEKYLHNLFVLWSIRFIGVTDNADTGAKGGKKARQINGLVNEWYCEDISDNVTSVLAAKKQNGQYLGHWCTFGYELDPGDKYKIVPDPPAAAVVREIYGLYLSGYGIAAIANILTGKQYPTPCVYKQSKGKKYYNPAQDKAGYSSQYGVWSNNTVRRILHDETYLGHLIQGREKKVSYKSKKVVKRPRGEWIVVRDNHEPIINQEDFIKAQNRLGAKSSNFKANCGEMPKSHLFAGKVTCMDCGSTMQKRYGKNRTQYLKCGLALKTKGRECSLRTIRLETLTLEVERRIRRVIESYIGDKENAEMLFESFYNKDDLAKELKKRKAALSETAKRREELSKGLASAYLDKINGNISEQHFQILRQNFDAEIHKIEEETEKTQAAAAELESNIKEKGLNTPKIREYAEFSELTHEIVNDFVDHIEIGGKDEDGGQPINIYWLF